MDDLALSRNYNPNRPLGISGDAVITTGTDSAVRSEALTVGQVYLFTVHGGGGYIKFGDGAVVASDSNRDHYAGYQDMLIGGSAIASGHFFFGRITINEGRNYVSVLRSDTANCTVVLTPLS